jgi:hypothetical protein
MALLMVRCSIALRSLEHNINDLLHSSQYFLSSSKTILIQGGSSRCSSHWAQLSYHFNVLVGEQKHVQVQTLDIYPFLQTRNIFLAFALLFVIAIQIQRPFDHITADCGAAGVAMTTGTCIHMSTAACVSYGPDSAKQVQMAALSSRFTACDIDWIAQNLHSLNSQRQTIPLPTRTFRETA